MPAAIAGADPRPHTLTPALISAGVKVWGLGSAPAIAAGTVLVLAVWFGCLRPRPTMAPVGK